MNALALTDHGNLHGALEFYQTAKDLGINPIVGIEAYIAPGSRFHKEAGSGSKEASYHLTLLAAEPHGLSEPPEALLAGLPGRFLFQAPHRQGTAGRPQRGADLPERLRLQRVEPRPADGRRRPAWKRPARPPPGSTRSSATATSSRSRTTAWNMQRMAMEGGRSSWPTAWACPWWPPATSTTCSAKTPRPRTSCCASTRASSAPTPTACGWRPTSSISAAPRRCTRPSPASDEALARSAGDRRQRPHRPGAGQAALPRLHPAGRQDLGGFPPRAVPGRARRSATPAIPQRIVDGQLVGRGHGPAGARAGRDQQAGLCQLLPHRLGLRALRPRAGHPGHGPRLGRRLAGLPTPCT